MRAKEFLKEAGLAAKELGKHDGRYLKNLITMITHGRELKVVPGAESIYGEYVRIDPRELEKLKKSIAADQTVISIPQGPLRVMNDDASMPAKYIALGNLEKTAEIKGKSDNYNIGDIGEIALGVATAARFKAFGILGMQAFVNFANNMAHSVSKRPEGGPALQSRKLTHSGNINYGTGKKDRLEAVIVAPGRSVDAFIKFMQDPSVMPKKVQDVIESAIQYVNETDKIEQGMEIMYNDPRSNKIEVLCDGVSDQKGTKADLKIILDGEEFNILSAKTGRSQLGQASGHEWKKQVDFFSTVFGIDPADLAKVEHLWGMTTGSHIEALREIYTSLIIPKITKLVGLDSLENEKILIKSLVNGLIRYSNNYNPESGDVETVEIVKLIAQPGSPGYKLLRIDDKLNQALMNTDLYGKQLPNNQGVEVYGKINGATYQLFKVRSYIGGGTVRTVIEGGPLLDQLSEIAATPQPQPAVRAPQAQSAVQPPASQSTPQTVPATAPSITPAPV